MPLVPVFPSLQCMLSGLLMPPNGAARCARKSGEGLSVAEFRRGVREGRIGHVGLRASAELIAYGLGWTLEAYKESIAPALGEDGLCTGIRQVGVGTVAGKKRIVLKLDMFVGATSPHDHIVLDSDPPIDLRIEGGTQGDRGTVGTVVNAISRLSDAPRGLITVADLFA